MNKRDKKHTINIVEMTPLCTRCTSVNYI